VVGAGGVNAVLVADDLPELGADLVAALAALDVNCRREEGEKRVGMVGERDGWWLRAGCSMLGCGPFWPFSPAIRLESLPGAAMSRDLKNAVHDCWKAPAKRRGVGRSRGGRKSPRRRFSGSRRGGELRADSTEPRSDLGPTERGGASRCRLLGKNGPPKEGVTTAARLGVGAGCRASSWGRRARRARKGAGGSPPRPAPYEWRPASRAFDERRARTERPSSGTQSGPAARKAPFSVAFQCDRASGFATAPNRSPGSRGRAEAH